MAFEKGNRIGNRFSSDNQPKNAGRKPALYKALKDLTGKKVDYELSKEDYYKVIRFVMERTPGDLKKIIENAKDDQNGTTPIWVLNIISAINSDVRYGRTTTIDSIFDRIFGRANQTIEADVNANVTAVGMPNLESLSTEELAKYNELLEKVYGKK